MHLEKFTILYVCKFILCFSIIYFGTLAVIGLAASGGKLYSPFIDHHFDYITWLRKSLIYTSKGLLSFLGFNVYTTSPDIIQMKRAAVKVGYDCLGYGVFSFWIAFIFANKSSWNKKILWILSGVISLWCINVLRISLLLIIIDKNLHLLLLDHHTWFNITAYLLIFLLIYLYDKSSSRNLRDKHHASKFT